MYNNCKIITELRSESFFERNRFIATFILKTTIQRSPVRPGDSFRARPTFFFSQKLATSVKRKHDTLELVAFAAEWSTKSLSGIGFEPTRSHTRTPHVYRYTEHLTRNYNLYKCSVNELIRILRFPTVDHARGDRRVFPAAIRQRLRRNKCVVRPSFARQ